MQKRNDRRARRMLAAALMVCGGILSTAQSNNANAVLPDSPKPVVRSIEDLNYLGRCRHAPILRQHHRHQLEVSPGHVSQGTCVSSDHGAAVHTEPPGCTG